MVAAALWPFRHLRLSFGGWGLAEAAFLLRRLAALLTLGGASWLVEPLPGLLMRLSHGSVTCASHGVRMVGTLKK